MFAPFLTFRTEDAKRGSGMDDRKSDRPDTNPGACRTAASGPGDSRVRGSSAFGRKKRTGKNRPIADIGPLGHIADMGNKRGSISAGELLTQLAADPEYQAMRRARDQELAIIAEQRTREQQALLQDLAGTGVAVDSIGQLLEMPSPDARIYPVLLDHLTKAYSAWLSEWIGRAFGRKTARPIVWSPLVDLLKSHSLGASATEGVMAALSQMAQPADLDTLIDLFSDTSLGSSRLYLVRNLMRSKRSEARTALLQHQADPDLSKEITARLSRSRG